MERIEAFDYLKLSYKGIQHRVSPQAEHMEASPTNAPGHILEIDENEIESYTPTPARPYTRCYPEHDPMEAP